MTDKREGFEMCRCGCERRQHDKSGRCFSCINCIGFHDEEEHAHMNNTPDTLFGFPIVYDDTMPIGEIRFGPADEDWARRYVGMPPKES
jgi:hypothetical protein